MGELIATGRSSYLERLEAEVPPTLLDILAIPGMGPRTVATLWREAGITTVDELEAAARRGGLDGLPRLGRAQRGEDRRRAGRALRARRRAATPSPTRGGGAARGQRCARRCRASRRRSASRSPGRSAGERETCGDLDLLVATEDAAAVLVAFAALPEVERVLARGATKSSVHVDGGFQVDCRAVPPEFVRCGAAVLHRAPRRTTSASVVARCAWE